MKNLYFLLIPVVFSFSVFGARTVGVVDGQEAQKAAACENAPKSSSQGDDKNINVANVVANLVPGVEAQTPSSQRRGGGGAQKGSGSGNSGSGKGSQR